MRESPVGCPNFMILFMSLMRLRSSTIFLSLENTGDNFPSIYPPAWPLFFFRKFDAMAFFVLD